MKKENDILERSIEKYLKRKVEELGGKCIKIETSSETGWPDRLVIIPNGNVAFIETKRPKGGRLAERQILVRMQLSNLNCNVYVAKTKEDVDMILEGLK